MAHCFETNFRDNYETSREPSNGIFTFHPVIVLGSSFCSGAKVLRSGPSTFFSRGSFSAPRGSSGNMTPLPCSVLSLIAMAACFCSPVWINARKIIEQIKNDGLRDQAVGGNAGCQLFMKQLNRKKKNAFIIM